MTRDMPGLRSPNCNTSATMRPALVDPSPSRSATWLTKVKTLCSMKSIKPSNIWAFEAKCRYKAASLTCNWAAKAAVVTRSAPGFSSMAAKACKIWMRRSPGLGRLRAVAS
jgi:hypothetical protein